MTTKKFKPFATAAHISLGCDPEFFFIQDKEILGAEKIIPEKGLHTSFGGVIIDGVQAELNPTASGCRESLSIHIARLFQAVQTQLNNHKGVKVDFNQTVKLSKKELDSLKDENKKFGCDPSFSLYPVTIKASDVDGSKCLNRAAGGHIHFGLGGHKHLHNEAPLVVGLLDVLVGNTCVLLDRNPGNIERRKLYGRAGEYRLPSHGLEYRTLSNFWLRHYCLMSLVFGMARSAVQIAMENIMPCTNYKSQNLAEEILKKVKIADIQNAINNNNFDLALKNFKKIDFAFKVLHYPSQHPLCEETLPNFYKMVETVQNKGLEYYFPVDPLVHWVHHNSASNDGGGTFLTNLHPRTR